MQRMSDKPVDCTIGEEQWTQGTSLVYNIYLFYAPGRDFTFILLDIKHNFLLLQRETLYLPRWYII